MSVKPVVNTSKIIKYYVVLNATRRCKNGLSALSVRTFKSCSKALIFSEAHKGSLMIQVEVKNNKLSDYIFVN